VYYNILSKTQQTSSLRSSLSKIDLDPGYFCKFVKDQFVRNFIKQTTNPKILDIGCDTCYIAGLLNYDKFKFSYLGLDIEDRVCKEHFKGKNQQFKIMKDISDIYKLDQYDIILLLDVIEHMKNKEQGFELIDMCFDKLKKGGKLIISTPNQLGKKVNWPKYHKFEYTFKEIMNHCEHKLITCFGWSMDDDLFKISCGILPKEVKRVLHAINNPDLSRDVLYVYEK